MQKLKDVLLKMPKSELHVHLRGAMPPAVLADLLNKTSIEQQLREAPARHLDVFRELDNIRPFLTPRRWSVEDVSSLFRYETFDQFLYTWVFTRYLIHDAADLRRLMVGVVEGLRAQNVVYVEITISLVEYITQGIPLASIKACMEEATDLPGIQVQWIVDLVRDSGKDAALKLLREVVNLRCPGIVGVTLGGSEHLFPPAQFAEVYDTAREHGLRLSIHAGEALGPESVWDALLKLGAERIGHGVRAIEDASLVSYLAENRIPLEVCPTSNLQTAIYPSYEAHPAKVLFESGIPITINSDDPTFFRTTLAEEYAHVHGSGVGAEGILEMIKNGFRYAFLPKDEIARYLLSVDRAWQELSSR